MRRRFRQRPVASSLAVLAYLYTMHYMRLAIRESLEDTPLHRDAELWATGSTYFLTGATSLLLLRWRQVQHQRAAC